MHLYNFFVCGPKFNNFISPNVGGVAVDQLLFGRSILPVMFFSPPDLRAPSADRRETLPHDRKLTEFYNAGPKIRGALPQKKFGGKNMQNFGRFYTTFDF